MPKRLTTEEFVKKSQEMHGDKYDYSSVSYTNNSTAVDVVCKIHGKFSQRPIHHLNGFGCSECSGKKQLNSETFIGRAVKIHGDEYDYSQISYKNANTPVKIICKKHGTFLQGTNKHLSGSGCFKCYGKPTSGVGEFICRAKKVHGDKYDYSNVKYTSSHKKIKIVCLVHGPFIQAAYSHLNGRGCPECGKEIYISKPEREFLDYIKIPEKNRQRHIGQYVVDGIIEKNIYEFLGDWWHGNPKVFSESETHPSLQITYGELLNKTFKRFEILSKMGYTIQYVWENDWLEWKRGKTKNLLINTYG
jgi:hypothetical protein